MAKKLTAKQFERNQKLKKLVLGGLLATILVAGGGYVYSKYEFAKQTDLPMDKMFTSYQNQPIILGDGQNTPTKSSEVILTKATNERPVLYVFYKVGCKHCQNLFPDLKSAIKNYQGKASIYWVNVESDFGKGLVAEFGVTKASTLVAVGLSGQSQTYVMAGAMDAKSLSATFKTLGI